MRGSKEEKEERRRAWEGGEDELVLRHDGKRKKNGAIFVF